MRELAILNTHKKFQPGDEDDVEIIELRGFSRSIAELEWLLLILVILYLVTPGTTVENDWLIIKSGLLFGLFVLAFRYLNFFRRETRWKIGIEIWVMIIFITYVLWHTGKIHSPLLNLYLLVIVTSGLTMGKSTTLLILALITSVYIRMGVPVFDADTFSIEQFGLIMTVFSPYLIIAYLTTMLSADLHFSKSRFKLLSETDEMTGLENIRSFKNTLNIEIMEASRHKHSFSVLMIDADGLKAINDEFGHDAGNMLIKTVANSIKSCLRESDRLARYGGDEFVVLLSKTSSNSALEAGERIRLAVENTSFDSAGNQLRATISIGIASYPEHAVNLEELMSRADRALYRSKEAGRNKVTVHLTEETDANS